jgi:hypothetical protein
MLMHAADSNVNEVAVTVWAPPKTWSPVIVAGALRKLVNEVFDPYRQRAGEEYHKFRPAKSATVALLRLRLGSCGPLSA